MTTPRSVQIDLSATSYYHCISRCVRHAYLCGYDEKSQKDYNHRKEWLINKIKDLAPIFFIQIAAYAVMDNHYHLVLHVNSVQALQASDDTILARWEALFPKNAKEQQSILSAHELKNKIEVWRKNLMDISCFMKLLNEYMARCANKEDEVNGRFWQGRFKSQALLDEAAVLGAMVYVDLNPIRAKKANTPETSQFTSIYERIKTIFKQIQETSQAESSQAVETHLDELKQPLDLMPFKNKNNASLPRIDFQLSDYLQLVESTGKYIRDDKKGHIPERLSPIFERLNINSAGWITLVKNLENEFYFAVGSPELLATFGRAERCNRIKGINMSKRCYQNVA